MVRSKKVRGLWSMVLGFGSIGHGLWSVVGGLWLRVWDGWIVVKRLRIKPKAKCGQAAIEFLITYGWAFLAVLVALGAFSYLGLLSPSAFLPEKCEIIAGFSCTDFQLTSRLLTLELVNSLGEQAILESVALYDTQDPTTPLCLSSTPLSFMNGEKKTVGIPCQQELSGGIKMNAKISLRYSKQLGTKKFPSHVLTGRLYALVQP